MKLTKNKSAVKILSFLLCIALLLSLATFLRKETNVLANPYYTAPYERTTSGRAAMLRAANALNEKVVEESIVLLKNEDNALPITKANPKISIFGKSSVNLQYGLSGSSGGDGSGNVGLYKALRDEGFDVNPTLETFYNTSSQSGSGKPSNNGTDAPGMDSAMMYGIRTGETPQSSYTSAVKTSYASYNDAAVVLISRMGGESWDLHRTSRSGSTNNTPVTGRSNAEDHYLQLDDNERDLLKALDADPNFSSVIVLINSPNVMELGFLDDSGHYAYSSKIKAAMWIGLTGASGAAAVGRVLNGKVNPSGRLANTYNRDHRSDPTWQNFGNGTVASGNSNGSNFVHYDEDIYVGYRYWETRGFTEGINKPWSGSGDSTSTNALPNAVIAGTTTTVWDNWYKAHVVYPFGYGLSYTNFKWTIVDQSPAQNAILRKDDIINVTVNVENIGTIAGKDVVQLYYTSPYKKGGISKSHVVLGAFEKTDIIQPGSSQNVTITMKASDMYSYDWSDANGNGFKGYELESGNYDIFLANDANCWADNSSIKLEYSVPAGGYKYAEDTTTGAPVKNLFSGSTAENIYSTSGPGKDADGKNTDSNFMGIRQYLTRDNWVASWPTHITTKRTGWSQSAQSVSASSNASDPWYSATAPTFASSVNSNSTIKLVNMAGRDYDDPLWDVFMSQLTIDEHRRLIGEGFFTTTALPGIGKPRATDQDGPFGWVPLTHSGGRALSNDTCRWASPVNMASTYNKELMYEVGQMVGMEGIVTGGGFGGNGNTNAPLSGIYAPGINTHRSQFGGRNGEYYSEDGYLAGIISAKWVAGAQSKGVYCYMKHYMLNDQETSRGGIVTWVSEQALREIYGRGFEIATKEGGATGVMAAFNRIGRVHSANNYAALTALLRDEWGFRGSVITDWGGQGISTDLLIRTGTDLYLCGNSSNGSGPTGVGDGQSHRQNLPSGSLTSDATQLTALRKAAKNILYTAANSNQINGYTGATIGTNFSGRSLTAVNRVKFNQSIATAVANIGNSRNYKYEITEGNLPQGLSLSADGLISGTATQLGNFTITVRAVDASNAFIPYTSATAQFTIAVEEYTPRIHFDDINSSLFAPQDMDYEYNAGVAYTLDPSNNYEPDDKGFTYILKGTLPNGLSLSADGKISGKATLAVTDHKFTITASKQGFTSVDLEYSITVKKLDISFVPQSLPLRNVGERFVFNLNDFIQGNIFSAADLFGELDISYSVHELSTLPQGLSLMSNGILQGTIEKTYENYDFSIVITAKDSNGMLLCPPQEAKLYFSSVGIIFENRMLNAYLNKDMRFDLRAMTNDGEPDAGFTFRLEEGSKLPNGITMSSSGQIRGKSNATGSIKFTVIASKEGYADVTAEITLVVKDSTSGGGGCGSVNTSNDLIIGLGAMMLGLAALGFVITNRKQKKSET